MKIKKTITFLFFFNTIATYAQLPNTDIWLLNINKNKDSIWLSNPQNITNRSGYDNQPTFSPDGKYILYTSIRDEKQSDIYKYDLKTKQTIQFTNTLTSEYSPTFMPNGKKISVVMVESDSTQRLWEFPITGKKPSCIINEIDSVGYHCWINKKEIALCIITEPMTLYIYQVENKKMNKITDRVGRSIHSNNNKLFYLQENTIYSFSSDKKVAEATKNFKSEDFNFIKPNVLIMAEGNKLFIKSFVSFGKDGIWKTIADLSSYGIKKSHA